MKRLFIAMLLSAVASSAFATKFNLVKGKGLVADEKNNVFLFSSADSITISFRVEDSLKCTWYRYSSNPDESEKLAETDYSQDSIGASLYNVKLDYGYFVEYGDSSCDFGLPCREYLWAMSYKPIKEVSIEPNEFECQRIDLKVLPALTYVNKNGAEKIIKRNISYSYSDLSLNNNFEMETITVNDKTIADTIMTVRTPAVNTKISLADEWQTKLGLPVNNFETAEFKSILPVAFPVMLSDEKVAHEADANYSSWKKMEDGKVALPFAKEFKDALADTSKFKSSAEVVIDFKCYHNDKVSPKGYVWEFISGINAEEGNFESSIRQYDSIMNSYRFAEPGLHCIRLTVSDEDGKCESQSYGCFRISQSALWIPNAFSPNGDGKNDEFRVAYRSIDSYRCRIYDQWGRKVYDNENISEGWDGEGHSIGVYFYVIEARGTDGTRFNEKGTINLVRDK